MLNKLVVKEKKSDISSQYYLISLNIPRCCENNTYSEKVYRRLYSMGENFSPEEIGNNVINWGSYKTGLLNITPENLKTNLLRIERTINYHILKHKNLKNPSVCPICGGEHIKVHSDNTISCSNRNCYRSISITYCNHCDPKHERPIFWVKYAKESFLEDEEVVDVSNMATYDKLERLEAIMGEHTTTSFQLEKENKSWKLKTVCPHCGIKLGELNNK